MQIQTSFPSNIFPYFSEPAGDQYVYKVDVCCRPLLQCISKSTNHYSDSFGFLADFGDGVPFHVMHGQEIGSSWKFDLVQHPGYYLLKTGTVRKQELNGEYDFSEEEAARLSPFFDIETIRQEEALGHRQELIRVVLEWWNGQALSLLIPKVKLRTPVAISRMGEWQIFSNTYPLTDHSPDALAAFIEEIMQFEQETGINLLPNTWGDLFPRLRIIEGEIALTGPFRKLSYFPISYTPFFYSLEDHFPAVMDKIAFVQLSMKPTVREELVRVYSNPSLIVDWTRWDKEFVRLRLVEISDRIKTPPTSLRNLALAAILKQFYSGDYSITSAEGELNTLLGTILKQVIGDEIEIPNPIDGFREKAQLLHLATCLDRKEALAILTSQVAQKLLSARSAE